MTAPYNW